MACKFLLFNIVLFALDALGISASFLDSAAADSGVQGDVCPLALREGRHVDMYPSIQHMSLSVQ